MPTPPAEPSLCKPTLAIFDFDGTLTYADSLLPFLRELAGSAGFWHGMVLFAWDLAGLLLRGKRLEDGKEMLLRRFLGGRPEAEIDAAARRFVNGRLRNLLNPRALDQVAEHQRHHHRIFVVSASPEIYLSIWTSQQNPPASVLGTRLEVKEGVFTGSLAGANCKGPEKISRLREALGPLENYQIYVYSDNRTDLDLLRRARNDGYRTFQRQPLLPVRISSLWTLLFAPLYFAPAHQVIMRIFASG